MHSLSYCIGTDRYFKREDVGIIYQMNVVPGQRRKLVGATLIKALFDRAAYGCRLYCCWCAQDIEANHFWESLGFIPLAFRAGSRDKGRTHIFWQRRIREGDTTTPYWFPSQTNAGAIREDRLVLPIPPGTHWSDAKPMILPTGPEEAKALPSPRDRRVKRVEPIRTIGAGGLRLGPIEPAKPAMRPAKQTKAQVKNDPAHVAAARELRDRYLERFNAGVLADGIHVLPGGKYQVVRTLADSPGVRASGSKTIGSRIEAAGASWAISARQIERRREALAWGRSSMNKSPLPLRGTPAI